MTSDLPAHLTGDLAARLDALLAPVDAGASRASARPLDREPVHVAYVPADAFGERTVTDWGEAALAALDQFGSPESLGVDEDVLARVRAKLSRDPIEDLRVDFEDGYGDQGEAAEDAHAEAAGTALRAGRPTWSGVRVKGFAPVTRRRALRTLELLLGALGEVPEGFVVTIPKVTAPEHVRAADELCQAVDEAFGGSGLRFEVQVETPAAVARMAELAALAGDRCAGLHYGTYDYSAALGVAASEQSLEHPVADHAKAVMQLHAATRGLRVVDGSSNVLPVGSGDDVRAAWALHQRLVDRSLRQGLYAGWDLHPAQLVSRYVAVFAFYRRGFDQAAARLHAYRAQLGGGVLDEPATVRALAGFLVRGLDCGGLDAGEVSAATGLTRDELVAL